MIRRTITMATELIVAAIIFGMEDLLSPIDRKYVGIITDSVSVIYC